MRLTVPRLTRRLLALFMVRSPFRFRTPFSSTYSLKLPLMLAAAFQLKVPFTMTRPPLLALMPPFTLAPWSITNVPGPQVPLYNTGARVVANYGTGPILDGMGLFHAITSYCGDFAISATSCRLMVPDPDFYRQCLFDTYQELKDAAEKIHARAAKSGKAKRGAASKKPAGKKTAVKKTARRKTAARKSAPARKRA